ncbi:MAG: hypothetical protein HZB26_20220 [Candidatus Hydrogenedentes bacterium]|nr:hypothetical protein [Candidatus Hydrogenedentota bacterium]
MTMAMKTVMVALVLVFAAGVITMAFTEKAYAAGDGMDGSMSKKGFDALANKKFKTASWPQICVGLASIPVAWAVVKYL